LATSSVIRTLPAVLVVLRFAGLINAAVWLGAGVFFTLGIGTAVFADDVKNIFAGPYRDYYPGVIAQIFLKRYFIMNMVCGVIALGTFCAEAFYTRRRFQKWTFALFMVPLVIAALGGLVLQPRMKLLHLTKYQSQNPDERTRAAQLFGRLHALSSTLNLLSLGCLIAYTWRVANPQEPARFVSAQMFRG
jgi:hypothetical protein